MLTITLLNQRIQVLLFFFSLVVGGALNARVQAHMSIIWGLGSVVAWSVTVAIVQTQRRLNRILEYLCAEPTHPYTLTERKIAGRFRIQPILSYVVPLFCSVTLTVATVLSLLGWLAVATGS